MADLSQWSAQALQYHGSAGPPTVMYYQTRQQLVDVVREIILVRDPLFYDKLVPKEMVTGTDGNESPFPHPTYSKSAAQAALDGDLFDPPKVIDNFGMEHQEENRERRIKSIVTLFLEIIKRKNPKDNPQVHPLDTSDYIDSKSSYPSHHYHPNKEGGSKNLLRMSNTPENNADIDTESELNDSQSELSDGQSELSDSQIEGVFDPRIDGYKYALVLGLTTEFNPSGIWIVEYVEESQH